MPYDILHESCPWHTRVGLFNEQGKLLSLRMDDCDRPLIEGAVVLGRVRRIVPGLNAAFVDIGDTVDGFLRLSTLPNDVPTPTEGQPLMVRITRGSDLQKGARLDARVSLKMPAGDLKIPSVLMPAPSALRRILMDAGDTPVRCWVVDDRTRPEVTEYVQPEFIWKLDQHEDCPLLEELDAQLDDMHTRSYPISGGKVTVEVTKALTAIDVDAGDLGGNRKNAVLSLNLAAAEEVVRLCSLLDLGGNVVVDFVSMVNENNRRAVQKHLKKLFRTYDMAKVEVFPMSRFGLVEINRERRGAMLHELLSYPTYVAGRILLNLWRQVGFGGEWYVDAAPPVVEVLKQRLTTDAALAYFGRPVNIKAHADWPVSRFAIAAG